jgi:hypothetical protein
VRTLVVSDLHLGSRQGRDLLRDRAAHRVLLDALAGVDRLVLLGDIVELLEGRPREAMSVAEPLLRAVGQALGGEREVIVVPGNHDRELIGAWLDAHVAELSVDTMVPADAGPELAALADWLAPARVSVHYPGVWLAEGIWATHGHYLDRHLLPVSAFGIARGLLGPRPAEFASPADYEAGPHLTRLEALLTGRLPRALSALLDEIAGALRAAAMARSPSGPHGRLTRNVAPVLARLLGLQMRRAAIPALAQVVTHLQVSAHTVIFGHVHRLGPGAADDPAEWAAPSGAPRILNTGCWVYEPLLLAHAQPPHPYWPGGSVLLEDHEASAISLL